MKNEEVVPEIPVELIADLDVVTLNPVITLSDRALVALIGLYEKQTGISAETLVAEALEFYLKQPPEPEAADSETLTTS